MDRIKDRDRMMDRDTDMNRTHDGTKSADRDRLLEQDRDRDRDRDSIYGADLMSQQERTEYHHRLRKLSVRLREFATSKERIKFRLQHQEKMRERAREKALILPAAM